MNFRILLFSLSILFFYSTQVVAQQLSPDDPERSSAVACLEPFYHGVASGDPLSDRVILWTRVTTDSASVDVNWQIATDTNMINVVNSGTVSTDASKDFTVKVDATGLQPFTWYYYEFEAYGKYSVRGRTRTLPVGNVDSLRFAIVSCQQYTDGYYNAYAKITERNDLFAVIHLGDYIYEYGGGTAPRAHDPANEIITLSDYRMRHSQYRLDEDLMRTHQQYPFFAVWDDHETANNSWMNGAENHDAGEGNWIDRKAYGIQAYYEWMPLRMPDQQDTQRIYRKFRIGDLMELYMMDTRLQGREEQNGHDTDPNRTLLGQQQLNWFLNSMDTSTAQWQVMGQQVMFAPLAINSPFGTSYPNDDQWDGYPAERDKIIDSVLANNIDNFVVLTGDIHTSWGNDIPTATYDPATGAGSAGVEFVATSITSQGASFLGPLAQLGNGVIQASNPHMKYINLTDHGYVLLDVNQTRTQGEWWYVDQISSPGATESMAQAWLVNDGDRYLQQYALPSTPSPNMVGIQAPFLPRGCNDTITSVQNHNLSNASVLLGVYPNPFNDEIALQFTLNKDVQTSVAVFDALGRQVANENWGMMNKGMYEKYVNLSKLEAGAYIIVLKMGDKLSQRKLIKTAR
jgi:alkaline phosphatase D